MRWILIVISLLTIFLAGQVSAANRAQKAQVAKEKAEVLEQNAAPEGSQTVPSPSERITKPEAQAVDPRGEKTLDDAITCLARTIYWEARGEEVVGMEAIANVVMNRLGIEGFPNTICEVVMQGQEQGACQFSWWCDGQSDDAQEAKSYATAKEIARKALNRQLPDRSHGALFFSHRSTVPNWATEYLKTAEVGDHVFYRPQKGSD